MMAEPTGKRVKTFQTFIHVEQEWENVDEAEVTGVSPADLWEKPIDSPVIAHVQVEDKESSEDDFQHVDHEEEYSDVDDEEQENIMDELRTDDENPLIEPFTLQEAEDLKSHARAIGKNKKWLILGYRNFIEEHLRNATPIIKLLHAFDFSVPEGLLEAGDEVLWTIFARQLRKFCERRFKLPHLNSLDDAVELIKKARRILVLTGAGISVSCGIPDFRSENGLYSIIGEKYPDLDDPQQMFDIHYFRHNPRPFFDLAKKIFPSNFQPSQTHKFIKLLEDRQVLLRNYTQNIDTLEKSAGISNVVHCHGSFDTATCQRCDNQVDCNDIREDIFSQNIPFCTICTATASGKRKKQDEDTSDEDEKLPIMKPDIVFFGESLPHEFDVKILMDRHETDLMIVIGSSLKVAPVADLVGFIPHEVPLILINREPVYHLHDSFDIQLLGYCDQIVGDLCARLGWEFEDAVKQEPAHIHPNIYLYEGAVFDQERHRRLVSGEEVETEEDSEGEEDMPAAQ